MKIPLVLALAFVPISLAFADGGAPPVAQESGPAAADEKPAPELLALEKKLTQEQEATGPDRDAPEQYRDFVAKFRATLDDTMSRVAPTPANQCAHARILTRLGDSNQALKTLNAALENDPENPALVTAKAYVLYDQKDYPATAAAANAILNSDPHNRDALWLKHASEDRDAPKLKLPGSRWGDVAQQQGTYSSAPDDSNEPFTLAIKSKAKPDDIPALAGPRVRPPRSTSAGLWDRAADGLALSGSDWNASADAKGEDGFSGVGKAASKVVGKGLVTAGGLMDALPVVADWTLDKDRRLMSGDLAAVSDISRGAYTLGKTAVVGFARDARTAGNDWADLVTLKNPTTYQALKATAHTEAILANLFPVGLAERGGAAGVETVEAIDATAGRQALTKDIALGGRELGENAEKTAALSAGRDASARFTTDGIKITPQGVAAVEGHLTRFEADAPNAVMVERLGRISRGELTATRQDLEFYAHELREKVLYRQANIPDGQLGPYEIGSGAHARALKEYGLTNDPNELYHPDANVAGEDAKILKAHGLKPND